MYYSNSSSTSITKLISNATTKLFKTTRRIRFTGNIRFITPSNEMDPEDKGFIIIFVIVFILIFLFGLFGRVIYRSNDTSRVLLYLKYKRKSTQPEIQLYSS
jgi:hypothetical protein